MQRRIHLVIFLKHFPTYRMVNSASIINLEQQLLQSKNPSYWHQHFLQSSWDNENHVDGQQRLVFFEETILIAFNQSGWWKVMLGVRITVFPARSLITRIKVNQRQRSNFTFYWRLNPAVMFSIKLFQLGNDSSRSASLKILPIFHNISPASSNKDDRSLLIRYFIGVNFIFDKVVNWCTNATVLQLSLQHR